MHGKIEQKVENDRNFSLFFSLPNHSTIGLHKLSRKVKSSEIRSRLEIQAGLPSHIYHILLPGGNFLQEPIKFGKDLKNGAVLKIILDPLYEKLYSLVTGNRLSDPNDLYKAIVNRDGGEGYGEETGGENGGGWGEGEGERKVYNAERSLILLFLVSFHGQCEMAKILLHFDPEGLERKSEFGRTAFHVAAAKDQIKVINLFLAKVKDFSPKDIYGKTPLEYSRAHGAFTCERLIRFKVLTLSKIEDTENKKDFKKNPKNRKSSQLKIINDSKVDHYLFETETENHQGVQDGKQDMNVKVVRDVKDSRGSASLRVPVNTPRSCYDVTSGVREGCHSACYKTPAFVSLCKIPLEDQKLVTVEFKPMDRPLSVQSPRRLKIKSKLQGSSSLEKKDGKLVEVEGNPSGKRRTKSAPAQYYKTKYHKAEEEPDYRQRPASATTRFRYWKTWLLDQDAEEKMKKKREAENQGGERHKENMTAFKRWLADKEREERKQRAKNPKSDVESESSDDDNDTYRPPPSQWPTLREQAYHEWLEKKRTIIVQLAHKKRLAEAKAKAKDNCSKIDIYDRKLTCFEIGCTDPTPVKHPPVDNYITDFRMWHAKRERFEAWKSKNEIEMEGQGTGGKIEEDRRTFHREGMTYEQWLGLKHREFGPSKPSHSK